MNNRLSKKIHGIFLLWLCISLLPVAAIAQTDQFQFSRLDINNGLSHNQVNCILKDSKGFMWFGTLSGLNRYDGYKFKIFKHSSADTTSLDDDFIVSIVEGPAQKLWVETRNGFNIYDPLTERFSHDIGKYLKALYIPDPHINAIKKDRQGNFWFSNSTTGLYKYNPPSGKTIHLYHHEKDAGSIYANAVSDVSEDSKGNMWLIYYDGTLEKLDAGNYRVSYRSHIISPLPPGLNTSYHIMIDREDDIWAFVPTYSSGVYYLSGSQHVFKHIDKGAGQAHLDNNVISNLIQDDQGRIWIATDHGGINLLNKKDYTIRYLFNREDDAKTVGQNSITLLYKDDTGIIWIGTYKRGVSYYHESIIKFPLYTHHLSDQKSISFSDVNCFAEEKSGNIWIGTNGGGLIYFDRKDGSFTTFLHNAAITNSLCNNVIICMYIDHNQKLWIGTYFGGLDCFDGKTFTHYRHSDTDTSSISEDRIWAIRDDDEHTLLVGTLAGGLNKFNAETKKFTHYKFDGNSSRNSLHSNYISALLEDYQKNLWIVTSYGVDVLIKKTHRFVHYIHDKNDPFSLVNNNTNNIYQDSQNLIWISTREGISIFDYKTGKFTNINKQDGLPDNTVIDMQEDYNRNMWVSTPNGLSNIIVDRKSKKLNFKFINYNEADGLQGREFTENSSLKTHNGELIFGGGNGFNIFDPSKIPSNKNVSNLVFTDFEVFNQSLSAGEKINNRVILPQAITFLNNVQLKYNDNVFSIEFSALNYFNPDKVKFEYMMQGFDHNWIPADNKIRKATYTNLDPASYVFRVRESAGEKWSNKEIRLIVNILPPFWKTPFAYILYALVIIGALFYFRRQGIEKIRMQFALEHEREEAHRMHELDLMKIKFLTNISHEFRTPLSLIMAPVDKILKQVSEPGIKNQLLLINRNAKRLLNLVNQLLDFRKMEHHELNLYEKPGDIIKFIKELSYSFTDVGEQKDIKFIFDTEIEEFYTNFDQDKIERIVFNLLSNAYKFTPPGGQVSVLLNIKPLEVPRHLLELKIIDTGIGIPTEKKDMIFEPFFQDDIPGNMLNQGSGIGLSITREFVKLHKGEMLVESEINLGSTFTVILPLEQINKPELQFPQLLNNQDDLNESAVAKTEEAEKQVRSKKKPTVLLVEDNEDFRFYIKDNLMEAFNIIEAENGKKGWQKTLAQHPNLVVSDITMPEMSGIELCRKIKNDKRTSHIPVILLTAMAGEEQQLKGLETGATDYMTKPFNFEILLSKIRNILSQQEYMRKTYQKQVNVKPTEMQVDSPDEAFIKKVLVQIEANIGNPNFSVEELSGEMFVSRYTLYKKILMMTGKTPNELVRSMRLKRAAQLLESGHLTISQVCHKVGFKSQKYFVRSFKAEYNTIPSKYTDAMSEGVS